MSFYVVTIFAHIAAAVVLLSTSVVGEPLVRAAVRRTASRQEIRAYLDVGRPMSRIAPIAAVGVLASGAYLTTADHFWTLGWIQVSTALWIVNAVVAGAVVRPVVARLEAEVAASEDPLVSPEIDRLRRAHAWSWGQDLLAINDVVMLWLMTARPGLAGSIVIVLLANVAGFGARQALGLRQPRVATA